MDVEEGGHPENNTYNNVIKARDAGCLLVCVFTYITVVRSSVMSSYTRNCQRISVKSRSHKGAGAVFLHKCNEQIAAVDRRAVKTLKH